MKIINLIEDTKGVEGCHYEHGLSFYIETKKHKLLLDTGATAAFIDNAKVLGIDLTKVDTVIISHGHYDHTGGLLAFADINSNAKIYIQKSARGDFYNCRNQEEKYIGMDKKISELSQVVFLEGDLVIDEELTIFTGVTGRKLWPKGNEILKKKCGNEFVQDDFCHEQYLVVDYSLDRIVNYKCKSESESQADDADDIKALGILVSIMTGQLICTLQIYFLLSDKEEVYKQQCCKWSINACADR